MGRMTPAASNALHNGADKKLHCLAGVFCVDFASLDRKNTVIFNILTQKFGSVAATSSAQQSMTGCRSNDSKRKRRC